MRIIKCQVCGKEVEATNNRQKYCPECTKAVERAHDKKYRENNKERRAAYDKERYEANKEQKIARLEKYPARDS